MYAFIVDHLLELELLDECWLSIYVPAKSLGLDPVFFVWIGHCPADLPHMFWLSPCLADHERPAVQSIQEWAPLLAKEPCFTCLYFRGLLRNAAMVAKATPPARCRLQVCWLSHPLAHGMAANITPMVLVGSIPPCQRPEGVG